MYEKTTTYKIQIQHWGNWLSSKTAKKDQGSWWITNPALVSNGMLLQKQTNKHNFILGWINRFNVRKPHRKK